jgi:hypothetical protein
MSGFNNRNRPVTIPIGTGISGGSHATMAMASDNLPTTGFLALVVRMMNLTLPSR